MGKLFDYEHPILRFLSKISDLFILNLITLLLCLPIVTIGASITAAHYTALKLHRNESYVFQNFGKSFRENFKQSTIIWLIFVVFFVVEYLAFITLSNGSGDSAVAMQGWLLATAVFGLCTMLWAFPMQSKFVNPIGKTIYTAFIMTFKHLLRTILILALFVLPFLLPAEGFLVILTFGFSLPIYLSAIIYNKPFQKMEEQVLRSLGQLGGHEGGDLLVRETIKEINSMWD